MSALPPLPPTLPGEANPYVGPRTFTRDQAHLFFGRDQEAEELFSRVVSQRLVLFYAQSGAGKSSLIQTKLIPQLEEAGFVVLPVARVGGDLLGGVDETVDNIYLFNLMISLDRSHRDPTRLAHLSLPVFLERLTTEDGKVWYYDEGEIGRHGDRETGRGGDGEGTCHLPPVTPNYVLIVDQFEEIMTTHGGRWPERAEFFRQLEAAMIADPTLWVVLTLREDFVASLDPYAPLLSDKLRARYYMQRMGLAAAKEAIRRPAAQYQRQFAPAAVDLLVNNLSQVRVAGKSGTEQGQTVEPVQLQVVCYQLWEKLQARPTPLISSEDVRQAGDVDVALAGFYEATLTAALQNHPLPGGERALRRWFAEKLITEAGTRGTVYQGESETAGLPNALVLELADRFLLRSESRAGGRWFELTHDRFVEPILAANQVGSLKVAAKLWRADPNNVTRLLQGAQLAEAQRFAATNPSELDEDAQHFLDACVKAEQAEQEAERQRQRRLHEAEAMVAAERRKLIAVFAAMALILLTTTVWALHQQRADTRNAVVTATAQAESARRQTEPLQQQIQADRLARIAALTNIGKALPQFPQRALLVVIEAAQIISPPLPTTLTTLHNLLGRTGGRGVGSHEGFVLSVAFAPDGKTLASAGVDLTIRLWSLNQPTASPVILRGHEGFVTSVAFAPDGQTLASASADNTIRLWSLNQPTVAPIILRGHEGFVTSVAFAPDGQTLASAADNTIRLWSLNQPTADPVILRGHEGFVWSVAFAPDGQTLASASADNTIRLWSLNQPTADPVILRGHEAFVTSVAFAPDGKTLASASADNTIRLWSLNQSTADPVILRGHEAFVTSVAFAPDGKTLASASADNTIRLWSLNQPTVAPVILRSHEGSVRGVAFAPDGQTLASAGDDRTIRLWLVTDTDLVLLACATAARNLSVEEWQQYFPTDDYRRTCRQWSLHP